VANTVRPRFRHPAIFIYLLGGVLGSGINFVFTLSLYSLLRLPVPLCFFLGTLANELFHHVYYHVVYVNQEIRLRTPLAIQLTLYVIVAAVAAGMLWVILRVMNLPVVGAVGLALVILIVLNTVINRISTFSSSQLAMVEYQEMGESFYDDQTDPKKVNRFRAAFHRSRFRRLTEFVDRFHRSGMSIADLGCGNCWWNVHGYPVIGVDVNEKMLRWAKEHNRLAEYRITDDLSRTGLPDHSLDIVIMSETLEHLLNLNETLAEVRRILEPDGIFLITVPYDFFLGPFFILFNINCLWQGYVRGSVYHRYRCGHVNHFTKKRLGDVLKANGFAIRQMSIANGLSLYVGASPY
jgi:SAM-dependent methyltransferase